MVHIFNRGAAGQNLFPEDSDALFFMRSLARAKEQYGFLVHVYCLMTNHFHLLIQLGTESMSDFMHWLETTYAVSRSSRTARRLLLMRAAPGSRPQKSRTI